MNKFGKTLLLAGVLLVAAAIAGVAQPHLGRTATPPAGAAITVTGDGTVDATPDRASFDFGVTTQVSLWPQTSNDGTEITGYQASNSVHVTAALGKSGELVDAAVGAGANNVEGPSLDTADKSSLYDQALQQALGDAKGKAQAIADAAGLTLGAVEKVREGGNTVPVPSFAAEKAATGTAVPIEAGTQQIQASVTVTYSAS